MDSYSVHKKVTAELGKCDSGGMLVEELLWESKLSTVGIFQNAEKLRRGDILCRVSSGIFGYTGQII